MSASRRFEAAQAVADAILYEGYLLYPYRRSSPKNRVRWQFGILAPRQWLSPEALDDTSVTGSADGWYQQTECLLEAAETAVIRIRLRFLHLHHRSVQQARGDGSFEPVDALTVDGRSHLTFDDAVPREHDVVASVAELTASPLVVEVRVPGGEEIELLPADAGRIVRSWQPVSATLRLSIITADAPFRLSKLRIVTENSDVTTPPEASRQRALAVSMIGTHTLIAVERGAFLSLLDRPEWAALAARGCQNIHTFPVLAAEPGRQDLMLSSPILLYDYPAVSPESPGDLFDAAEIDEILSLRTETLTDEEKREARDTDPRAAAIIDRVDGMPREVMERLHGAVRSLRPHRESPPNSVLVNGAMVTKGSRVRLRPRRRGTDAHDIFLTDRVALVEDVLVDMEDEYRIAVTLEDDPGADLHQWYQRFYYFSPDELSPLEPKSPELQPDS
ncbi:MAG: hypothetical protein J2P16_14120 [Mycobacterium sp.]|nr:hypothetical protein [Mycobacterium sp.]